MEADQLISLLTTIMGVLSIICSVLMIISYFMINELNFKFKLILFHTIGLLIIFLFDVMDINFTTNLDTYCFGKAYLYLTCHFSVVALQLTLTLSNFIHLFYNLEIEKEYPKWFIGSYMFITIKYLVYFLLFNNGVLFL